MGKGPRPARLLLPAATAIMSIVASGCAVMRDCHPMKDLRPCTHGYAVTDDGWRLGIKHYRAKHPDPNKLPVILCHGLGLNGTFWTIAESDRHLPHQLNARGYDVYVVDMRGSGASRRVGPVGRINSLIRQTPLLEIGDGEWSVDDEAFHDVPAILDYVCRDSGKPSVNWVGHSLGGMLLFPYLEMTPEPRRIETFVAMGAPAVLANAPDNFMLGANRSLRKLLRVVSTARMARPMVIARPPGLDQIDRLYYSAENVDRRTVSRFYGYTLENPGKGALAQLEPYLAYGRLTSADGQVDYASKLGDVVEPTLFVVGDGDVMAGRDSCEYTYHALGSRDKTLLRFGKSEGHAADYGHCDLVWSRHAPKEVFPAVIEWLDRHQPTPSAQGPAPNEQR